MNITIPQPESIVGEVVLPLKIEDQELIFQLYYYSFRGERWVAAIHGNPKEGAYFPLRIESACIFGHVFNSIKCDCGYQLDEAFRIIAAKGEGVVIYAIDQDARGIGIENHFKIYTYRQKENLDTEEVYKRLDEPVDARSYDPVAYILQHLGISHVLLLSNNPKRKAFLKKHGFAVKKEALEKELDIFNMSTLMLEKEDLDYEWSFKTHGDWLRPIQATVEREEGLQQAILVKDNKKIIASYQTRNWDLAEGLVAASPSLTKDRKNVVYLTDLPRIEDLPRYQSLGVYFIVVPFADIPDWLSQAAKAHQLFIQDWGRSNKYKKPRPQWNLLTQSDNFRVYQQGKTVRICMEASFKEQFIHSIQSDLLDVNISQEGRDWFEMEWGELDDTALETIITQILQPSLSLS